MTWKENPPLFSKKARRHSKAAKKGHRRKKFKKKIKKFVVKKIISSAIGLPDVSDIGEVEDN